MPGAKLNADLWIHEYISPTDIYSHGITRVLAHRQTQFQEMYIVESGGFGKGLVLDGKWQSCTGDEFIYHEPLVQPACVLHGGPKNVLVLGGGEGATVREVLKWSSVERCVMVDIDGEVVEACTQHLPEMHQGAFDDPRTELVIGDALHYLDESEGEWDLVISDLADPIEHGPSFPLFTKEYFVKCRRALANGGMFVLQAGPVSPPEMMLHVRLINTLRAVFPRVTSLVSGTASYGSPWGFGLATERELETWCPPAEEVDRLLAERTTGEFRMFDGVAMQGVMNVRKDLREAIQRETTVYTTEAPPRFFGAGVAGGNGPSGQ